MSRSITNTMTMTAALLIASMTSLSLASPAPVDPAPPQWSPDQCPSQCTCSLDYSNRFDMPLKTVNCMERDLVSIPESLPSDVEALLLASNHITEVRPGQLWSSTLLHLDLSNNRIESLHGRNPFEGVFAMRLLNLANNQMTKLNNGIFQGLFNLEELDVSVNRLAHIGADAFRGLRRLETLRLDSNLLTTLHPVWWRPLPGLNELSVSNNRLSYVPAESFYGLQELLSLDLSGNHIVRISAQAFPAASRLEYLRLSANLLSAVPREFLRTLRDTLKSILLDENPIEKLADGDFEGFTALREMSISNMQRLLMVDSRAMTDLKSLVVLELHDNPSLVYLSPRALDHMPSLTHLLLHNNNLTTLSQDTILATTGLTELSLYGNPIDCDCNARWLRNIMEEKPSLVKESERIVCDGPEEHKFKVLSSIPLDDLPLFCAPRILPTFADRSSAQFGEMVSLDCRATGSPAPRIQWILPSGAVAQELASDGTRVQLREDGATLYFHRTLQSDAGVYICVADNGIGERDEAGTWMIVEDFDVTLRVEKVNNGHAKLALVSDKPIHESFQVLYRAHHHHTRPGRFQYAGTVTPITHKVQLDALLPSTIYEACIAFEDDHQILVHISCATFATPALPPNGMDLRALEQTSNVAIGAALGIVASLTIVVCLVLVVIRRQAAQPPVLPTTAPKSFSVPPEFAVFVHRAASNLQRQAALSESCSALLQPSPPPTPTGCVNNAYTSFPTSSQKLIV